MPTMSDNDNLNLLEGDIDDGEYDLGHEEEAALLADDFQTEENTANEDFHPDEDTLFEYEEQEDVLVLNDLEGLEAEIQETNEEEAIELGSLTKDKTEYIQFEDQELELNVRQRESTTSQQVSGHSEGQDSRAEEERGRFKSERNSGVSKRGNFLLPDSSDTTPAPAYGHQQKLNQNRNQWRGHARGSRGAYGNRGYQRGPFGQQNARSQGRGSVRGGRGPGHQPNKIHINPHFRGNVQPQPDAARLVWDPNCVPPIVNQVQPAPSLPLPQTDQHGYIFQNQQPNMQQSVMQHPNLHQQQALLQQRQHLMQQQHQQHQHHHFNNQLQNFYPESQVTHHSHTPSPWMTQSPHSNVFAPQQNIVVPQQSSMLLGHQEVFQSSQAQGGQGQYMGPQGYQNQVHLQQPSHYQQVHSHQQQPFHQQKPQQQYQHHYHANRQQMHGGFEGPRDHQFVSPGRQPPGLVRPRGARFPLRGQRNFRGQPRPSHSQPIQIHAPPQKRLGPMEVPDTSLRSPPKRPKRKHDTTNLHQVETVDTLPDTTVKEVSQNLEAEIEEDEELREYRRKIEKQKELRETILQQKEERRKLAALEVQRKMQEKVLDILAGGDTSRTPNQPQGNAIATIVNLNTIEPNQTHKPNQLSRPKGRPMAQQHYQRPPTRGNITRIQLNTNNMPNQMRTVPVHKQNQIPGVNKLPVQQRLGVQLPPQRTVGSNAPVENVNRNIMGHTSGRVSQADSANTNLRVVRKLPVGQAGISQRGRGSRGRGVAMGNQRPRPHNVQHSGAQEQKNTMVTASGASQRVVTVSTTQPASPKRVVLSGSMPKSGGRTVTLRNTANHATQRIVMPPQRSAVGRTVIATSTTQPTSKSVIIENLAASTTSLQMLQICQSVGPLEKFEMQPSLHRVEVTFKSAVCAQKFTKTYHRKMIDLSLINVTLAPAT